MNQASTRDVDISRHFAVQGGVFVVTPEELTRKLKTIQALIFDWDGVFNDGSKGTGNASTFSEADSMGTNMLRYGLWMQNSRVPVSVVITGAKEPLCANGVFPYGKGITPQFKSGKLLM